MKAKTFWSLILMIGLTVSAGYAQQEFTFITTAANLGGIKASIDMPGLTGNPLAIIIATPLGGTATLNPHPIGAWYYSGKWYLFNVDSGRMPEGAKFKIQYFTQPDTRHFVHVINVSGAKSYIDHPELDNKPGIHVGIFQNHSPETRTPYSINPSEARVGYEAGKWFIQNVNNTSLNRGTSYNIVISPYSGAGSPIDTSNINTTGKTPITNPPNQTPTSPTGNAGGDLNGNYPNPTVIGLQGRPLSTVAPTVGQMLRWNGTEWEPVTINGGSTTINTGLGLYWEGTTLNTYYTDPMWNAGKLVGRSIMTTEPKVGQVLKWGPGGWHPADDNIGTTSNSVIEPLKFNPSLGKKIILYPGQTGDVGLSVQGNLLQIHSDHPNADVALGYDQAGTFNEKFRVKANGAIAVSGDTGQSGQVLTSNGAGSPPTWKQPTSTGSISSTALPIQTFFKQGSQSQTAGEVEISDSKPERNITELSHSIVLNKKSRLVISATIYVAGPFCPLGCINGSGWFLARINNIEGAQTRMFFSVQRDQSTHLQIINYMIDLNPGTHKIEFIVLHKPITEKSYPGGQYSSVIVIPLE